MSDSDRKLSDQEKVVDLFKYIKALNQLKHKTVLNIHDYLWHQSLREIPNDDENIEISYMDRVDDDTVNSEDNAGAVLLSVHRPKLSDCPQPTEMLIPWLNRDWWNFRRDATIKDKLETADGQIKKLEAYPQVQRGFVNWLSERQKWQETCKKLEKTINFFSELYNLYFELQRNSETEELIVANGMLVSKNEPEVEHPILTRRVRLEYDSNIDTIYIKDTETPTELYSAMFPSIENIHVANLNQLREELQENDYHPLDRKETPVYFQKLIRQLSIGGQFSENGKPANWQNKCSLLLYSEPCYILRKRLDGTLKAIEQIIIDLQDGVEIPAPIHDIVSGGQVKVTDDNKIQTVEEQLAEVGGESIDILLSKKANKEQLEIARKIEQFDAVLVQGPPGTGKTHTIANLLGHFLAKGESVLVTSYTTKALTVLKDKVVKGLQNLCVSVLDDTNADMEKSVDGITSYASSTNSFQLKQDMNTWAIKRKDIIEQLAKKRKQLFQIIHQERNCIIYNGKEISPSEAARFVAEHADDLSYIPGKINDLYSPFPLSQEELTNLYRSNDELTAFDEQELAEDLPSPDKILSPDEFAALLKKLKAIQEQLADYKKANWRMRYDRTTNSVVLKRAEYKIAANFSDKASLQNLKNTISSFGKIEDWMRAIAVDGKKGGAYRQRWQMLLNQIEQTCKYADETLAEQLGKKITVADNTNSHQLESVYKKLKGAFGDKEGQLSKLTLFFHKDYRLALDAVTINDESPKSAKDCDIIIHYLHLNDLRNECARYWDDLFHSYDVPAFFDLGEQNQEQIASHWSSTINRYLDWYQNDYQKLCEEIYTCGISPKIIFASNELDSDTTAINKIMLAVEDVIPAVCDILLLLLQDNGIREKLDNESDLLRTIERLNSRLCQNLYQAIKDKNELAYNSAYKKLTETYTKRTLQKQRSRLLDKIYSVAPQWADAIRRRDGIHGKTIAPESIEDAWKWKQLKGIISEITAQPFDKLQEECIQLSKQYREATAEYAEKSGWYHLLTRTEADKSLQQALQGWKQTVKKIGKGTGKRAPKYRAKARELMSKCQRAVPVWIMPINKALETLNPRENKFDVVIIDEASQADISSLAILYMGKKLIIVGDDKQVSPMAIGVNSSQIDDARQMYLENRIPNAHLYDLKYSIYDVAATTFHPLMLKEHFRCVPEIIGFSNMLSYDNKIKPLRDASSSNLLPAVVNYRVDAGYRSSRSKTNRKEAETIVALMQACFEQPEYQGKTFGVISLLGDAQAKLIQSLIFQTIGVKDVSERKILCGNSANFQGDERDVIFLSMVDSGDNNGPLPLRGFGPDDTYRKRYNVATSRAKDQLWVVNSLDSANDLKNGDIRKTLIDYAKNPESMAIKHQKIDEKAESPFEAAVAKSLSDKGYHLVQQWEAGAYRIDMVAIYGKNKVAIECDGERWHSSELEIRNDMERQTILERLGWRFIRIRGSEYYRNPEATIKRVIHDLNNYKIFPESVTGSETTADRESELLRRVKKRAAEILKLDTDENESNQDAEKDTIAFALRS